MAQIGNINPERIQWCCRMISVDLRHLADATKIRIDNLRQGRLTYDQLDKVAKFFGHTPIFFLGAKPLTAEEIYSPEFLALAGQKVPLDRHTYRVIQQVEWHRELYLCLIEGMEMEEDIPEFDPPALTGAIEEKADAVRKWLGLDDSVTRDYHQYRKLIEAKGILVFQSIDTGGDWDMRDSKAVGFSISYPQTPVIFIKKTTEPMQTLTLFMELGNIMLHNASCLDGQEQLTAAPVKQKMITPDNDYKEIKIETERRRKPEQSRRIKHKEPLQIFGRTYVGVILNALGAREITLNKTCGYLNNISVDDIRKIPRAWI